MKLCGRLTRGRDDVLEGRGFVVIRGIPGNQRNENDLIHAYWGIGTWLAIRYPKMPKRIYLVA